MRILVIEDEPGIAAFLKEGLEEESYAVDVAYDGKSGLTLALENMESYDIFLIDWMLPGLSGLEVTRRIREVNKQVPVIFLTAKDTTEETVFALDMGANDYIKKPFSFDELLARIRVQLRKGGEDTTKLKAGDLVLDIHTHDAFIGEKEIYLTQKEFALLEFLLRNKGRVCSRTRIIQHVWDINYDSDTSVIDVYINALRKKIQTGTDEPIIKTVRGLGYIIKD